MFLARSVPAVFLAWFLLSGVGATTWAQVPAPGDVEGTAVPGPRYAAGWWHRFLFGTSYRSLWTTPVTAEVLDLQSFGGGLTPTGTGGGKQTVALRFTGGDGRPYTFRALDKDPSETLPQNLRDTYVDALFQDQISAALPTAHVVVPVLLDAVGVLHSKPRLVILPDDPALGEFREQFRGKLGMIEEWPNEGPGDSPGFAGATSVVSSVELFELRRSDPMQRVEVREYLAARLIDILIGDWDRHRGQWRWANVGTGSPAKWRPIPEDRDQAFSRYDGLMLGVAREAAPQLTKFGGGFSGMAGATFNGRDLDRRLLVGLERDRWQAVAREVQAELTDAVLEEAVAQLPAEHRMLEGDRLLRDLRERRNDLPAAADAFYRHLAREVDLHLSDAAEEVRVDREDNAELTVAVYANGETLLNRRFHEKETRDLRIHLYGGDDVVIVEGKGDPNITLRLLDGDGAKEIEDRSRAGNTRLYDTRGGDAMVSGDIRTITKPYVLPEGSDPYLTPRDWGSRTFVRGAGGFSPDFGLLVGVGMVNTRYGFRKRPFDRRIDLEFAASTIQATGRVSFEVENMEENSDNRSSLLVYVSGIESVNFHGFGNDTEAPEDTEFYRMEQTTFRVQPSYRWALSQSLSLDLGAAFRYYTTELDSTRLIGQAQPYGSADGFTMVGVGGGVEIDTRDQAGAPTRGILLNAVGSYYPEAFSLERGDFAEVHGEASTYLTPLSPVTFAFLAGGKMTFGSPPFQEAAYLGGIKSLRGFSQNRFAGESSLYGTAELRLTLGRFLLLLPNTFGVLGLVDAGRVWVEDDVSDTWHTSFGAGLWLAPLTERNATIVGVAWSEEETRLYFSFGYAF